MSSEEKDHSSKLKSSATFQERSRKHQLLANACLLSSILALERGIPHLALTYAKQSVKVLRRTWDTIEERLNQQIPSSRSQSGAEKLAEDASQLSLSTAAVPPTGKQQSLSGSEFWALITPLFRSLSHLAGLYAHHGMFQETMYFAEQAHKLVQKVGSESHTAIASASLGSMWLKAGALDKGAEFLMAAKDLCSSQENSRDSALLAYHFGSMQGLLGDHKAEIASYEEMEATLNNLTGQDFITAADQIIDPADALEEKMSQLTVSKRKAPARKTVPRPKAVVKRKATSRAKAPVDASSSTTEECPQLMSLKAMVLLQKAGALKSSKGFADALSLLQEAEGYSNSPTDSVNHGLAMAKRLILQSMEQMNADPLYSVLQESTISFPSVVGHLKSDKTGSERSSATRLSPAKPKARKNSPDRAGSKSPPPESFINKLRQAEEHLMGVHSVALVTSPVAVIHSISSLLNSVAMLLSAADQGRGKPLAHPGFAGSLVGMYPYLFSPRTC
jgi:separase